MKVYCTRLPKNDQDILESLVGKDIWIMIEDRTNSSGRSWLRLLSKGQDYAGDFYWVNRKPAMRSNMYGVTCTPEYKESLLSRKYSWHCNLIRLVHPIEIMSTDELLIVDPRLSEVR